jgi:hypothetical protein
MIVNLVPELVNQTVLLENSKRYFKMEGFSGNDHFIKGIVAEFKRNFVCTLNMNFLGLIKKRQYRDLRKDLFRQFYGVYENNKFRKLLYRKQKPALYMLKYPKFKLHASWVRIYNETNRSHAWRGDKGAEKVKKFFNSFPFRKTLEFEPLKYIVSTSLICFEKLKREIDRNKIKTLDDILNAIQIPRDSSRLFLDECIGTEDVKLPLVVDTKNKRKYKNESFPRGQVTVIQTLFQKNRIIKKLNKHHNMELPLNGVYKFIGQSRGRSATTTTIFEDISATTDLLEYPLSENVNILIKNSTEFVKQRLIEDRLFKLLSYSPREKSYNIIVDITHPDDLEHGILPKSVIKSINNDNTDIPLGWIDIGVYLGSEQETNLSSVYGAIKYSRSKNRHKDHVDTAERILLSHHITKVSKDLILRMDLLFEKYNILNSTPRDLKWRDFLSFTIEYVNEFLSTKSRENSISLSNY